MSVKLKPYSEYKDSGVEWLGKTPAHWPTQGLKHQNQIIMGQSPDSNSYTEEDFEKPFLQGNAEFGHIHPKPRLWCNEATKTAKRNDILLSVRAPVGAVNIADREYGIGRGLCAVRRINTYHSYILYYILSIKPYLDSLSTGSTFQAISTEDVKNIPIPLPPLAEQKAIAAFLDRETQKIDTLVEKQEKLIALLEEKRQALISHAVTKGVPFGSAQGTGKGSGNGKKVKMKDPSTGSGQRSGVDPSTSLSAGWLGEIPEHWEVKRLKFLLRGPLMYGANEAAEEEDPDFPRFIRITDIDENGALKSYTFKSLKWEVARPYLLLDQDILFARSGGTVGKTIMYHKKWGAACFAGYLIKATVNQRKLTPNFLYQYVNSKGYWDFILGSQIQATIQNVSGEKYNQLPIPLPPLAEQKAIAAFLDRETHKIDNLINKAKDAIGLMKEKRSALISAAVTGKIDVRDTLASIGQGRSLSISTSLDVNSVEGRSL